MIRSVATSLFRALALAAALCVIQVGTPGLERSAVADGKSEWVFQGSPLEKFMTGKFASADVPKEAAQAEPEKQTLPKKTEAAGRQAEQKNKEQPLKKGSDVAPTTPSSESGPGSQHEESQDKDKSDVSALLARSKALAEKGKLASALTNYALAIGRATEAKNKKLTAVALHGAAQASYDLGKPAEASKYIRRAIALNQELKNARARSLDYLLAGRIDLALSKPEAALQSLSEAQKILPKSESGALPMLLENKGKCFLKLLRYSDALKELTRAQSLVAREGNELEAARLSVMIGEIYVSRSEYRAAAPHFSKAKDAYKKGQRNRELGETLYRIAYVHQMLGDLKGAQRIAREGESLLSADGDTGAGALPLLVRGSQAYREGKVNKAAQDLTTALRLCEKSGDRMMEARIRLALAQVQLDCSRVNSALELAGKALTDFRSLSSTGGEAASLLFVGKVYYRQGYVQKGLEYSQEAAKLSKKIGDRKHTIEACILLADIRRVR